MWGNKVRLPPISCSVLILDHHTTIFISSCYHPRLERRVTWQMENMGALCLNLLIYYCQTWSWRWTSNMKYARIRSGRECGGKEKEQLRLGGDLSVKQRDTKWITCWNSSKRVRLRYLAAHKSSALWLTLPSCRHLSCSASTHHLCWGRRPQ